MPMMKSPFDQQIISLTGHSPVFVANEPTWVPEAKGLVEECLGRGIKHCDDDKPVEVVAPEEKSDNSEDAASMFDAALNKALTKILVRDDPMDLKADLTPKITKVAAEMSPDLRRPTATEVSEAYQRLQENIDLAE